MLLLLAPAVLLDSTHLHTMTDYPTAFHPDIVLKSNEFKVLPEGITPPRDPAINLACAYAPGAKLHLIQKPMPSARKGEVVVHVKATGICGSGERAGVGRLP